MAHSKIIIYGPESDQDEQLSDDETMVVRYTDYSPEQKKEMEENTVYREEMFRRVTAFLTSRLTSLVTKYRMMRYRTRSLRTRFRESALRLCRPFVFYDVGYKGIPNPHHTQFCFSWRMMSTLIAICDGEHEGLDRYNEDDRLSLCSAYYLDFCDKKYDPVCGTAKTCVDPHTKFEIESAGFRLTPFNSHYY
jgi:hypothetical protein